MGCCYVSMRGKDGQTHSITLDAVSAFDAVDKATRPWSFLWWFDPDAPIVVQRGEQRWRISQKRVREWRKKQAHNLT